MLRVVFMGTPEFAVPALEAVNSRHSIVAVYSQPDKPVGRGLKDCFSPVKRKALELGLPVYQPLKLSLPGEFEQLSALQPDVIVIVAYGQILRKNILELPSLGCVNIHSSLLPRWRGAAPIQWAILGGDSVTGITTMKIVEKLDAGDTLLQEETPISPFDTAQSIHDRLSSIGSKLILSTLEGLLDNTLQPKPQNEAQVTYASKLTKEMEWLNPQSTAAELDLRVRALNPWPGTSLQLGEERLKVKKARPRLDLKGKLGEVFEKNGMLLLGTSEGSLELLSLQWDGKKEVDASAFLNGLKGRGRSLPLLVKSV